MLDSLLHIDQQLSLMQQLIFYFVVVQIISWLLMRFLFNSNVSIILAVIGPVFAGYMVYIALFFTKKIGLEDAQTSLELPGIVYWLAAAVIYLFFLLFVLGFEKNSEQGGYFNTSIFSIVVSLIVVAVMLETKMLTIEFDKDRNVLEEIHMQAPEISMPKLSSTKEEIEEMTEEDDIYVPR